MKMKIIIIVGILFLNTADLFSQGGVNVRYIAIDTVDQSLIGQKVKIDFKSTKRNKEYLIQKARIRDTVRISIDNKLITVIERKGTGADYWYFDNEYLESFDYDLGLILRIKEIEILEMRTDSILFRMKMERYRKIQKELERVSLDTKDIWISKEKIEGILLKE